MLEREGDAVRFHPTSLSIRASSVRAVPPEREGTRRTRHPGRPRQFLRGARLCIDRGSERSGHGVVPRDRDSSGRFPAPLFEVVARLHEKKRAIVLTTCCSWSHAATSPVEAAGRRRTRRPSGRARSRTSSRPRTAHRSRRRPPPRWQATSRPARSRPWLRTRRERDGARVRRSCRARRTPDVGRDPRRSPRLAAAGLRKVPFSRRRPLWPDGIPDWCHPGALR